MRPGLQPVGSRFQNFLLGKLSSQFKRCQMSIFHKIQMATFQYCVMLQSHGWACWYPTCTVYVDVTQTRSKINVKVTGLLNFRQLAKPCMLPAMTAAPLRGFLVVYVLCVSLYIACMRIVQDCIMVEVDLVGLKPILRATTSFSALTLSVRSFHP